MAKFKITKQPRERFFIGIDVTDELTTGDYIVLANSSVYESKRDANGVYQETLPEEIVETSTLRTANTDTILEAAISNGLIGEQFKISFLAVTFTGDKFEGDIFVSIKDL